jgi:hypothetical protein
MSIRRRKKKTLPGLYHIAPRFEKLEHDAPKNL